MGSSFISTGSGWPSHSPSWSFSCHFISMESGAPREAFFRHGYFLSPYQINMNGIEEDRIMSIGNKQFLSSVKSSSNGGVWSFDDVGCGDDENTNANDAPSISNWSMGGASIITNTMSKFDESTKEINGAP